MGIYTPTIGLIDHPLLYGNNGSLDPGTYTFIPGSKFQLPKIPFNQDVF